MSANSPLTITPSGETLGATVTGIDLAEPLDARRFGAIFAALGRHGVLRFPGQTLDARQLWHTDMSYSATIAFANVLYALKVPRRDGRPLGGTEFANMRAAYRDLPEEIKTRLDGMTVLHDFNKFWEKMRQR